MCIRDRSIGEEAITTEAGFPEMPHIAKLLAIPDNGTVSVDILETETVNIVKGITVLPSRESWQEGEPESRFIENSDFYSKSDIYPATLAKVEDPVIFRDFRIARLSIYPIRYSAKRNEIESISSSTVRVNYGIGS